MILSAILIVASIVILNLCGVFRCVDKRLNTPFQSSAPEAELDDLKKSVKELHDDIDKLKLAINFKQFNTIKKG